MKRAPNLWSLAGLWEFCRSTSVQSGEGVWVPARPFGLDALPWRLRCAWAVFTGRADAVTWPDGQ